jgi:hypothetical protein
MRVATGVGILALALAGVSPALALAQPEPPVVKAPGWRRHFTLFHLRLAPRRPPRDGPLSGARIYALRASPEPQPRPSLDTRVNELGEGATASIGYHPGVIPPTLGPHELDGAAAPRLGHSESTAGVSVKIPL